MSRTVVEIRINPRETKEKETTYDLFNLGGSSYVNDDNNERRTRY